MKYQIVIFTGSRFEDGSLEIGSYLSKHKTLENAEKKLWKLTHDSSGNPNTGIYNHSIIEIEK